MQLFLLKVYRTLNQDSALKRSAVSPPLPGEEEINVHLHTAHGDYVSDQHSVSHENTQAVLQCDLVHSLGLNPNSRLGRFS